MLERIGEFFDSRLEQYDKEHLSHIPFSEEIYTVAAELLPKEKSCSLLDLGCGTGLELEQYFAINPSARIVGIDLAQGMLNRLKKKFPDKQVTLIHGSYFDVPFGIGRFDAVLSVEPLHHYTSDQKIPLYKKIRNALKENAYFLLTDYFSLSDEEEISHQQEFLNMKEKEGICGEEIYRFDIPLTAEHETDCLNKAGCSDIAVLKQWSSAFIINALK